MFFRLVRLTLREGAFWPFRSYYESRILPALAATEGCRYAALLRPARDDASRSCDSLTLWETAAHADAYEAGGLYDRLLDGADPFLAEATLYTTDLARRRPGERPPLPDPEVAKLPVEAGGEAGGAARDPALFLRVVDHRVEPSRFDELRTAWQKEVAPELLATPGCVAAYLVEGLRGRSQALSVSFWTDEESAVRYEAGGRFDRLAERLRPFLSGLYQWRLSLAPEEVQRPAGYADLSVSGFDVVVGRTLRTPAA